MVDMFSKDMFQYFLRDLLYGIQFYTGNIRYYFHSNQSYELLHLNVIGLAPACLVKIISEV